MTNILLLILVLIEAGRVFLLLRPTSQKSYFKQRSKDITRQIWDLEFKRFKTLEVREEIRTAYDNHRGRLTALEERIKSFTGTNEDKKNLEDDKVRLEKDIERYKEQMKMIDLEIEGSKPISDYPNGLEGINHQLDSLREVRQMVGDWIKTL